MHAAVERVVQREHVAVGDPVAEPRPHGRERRRHGAEMGRQRETLRDHASALVEEAGRVVEIVAQHRRVGGPVDRQRHLIGNRQQRAAEQLKLERV